LSSAKKTIALVHQTWLAGVGVYDSGREKAANKFDQLFVDGSALVNDLLEKGELLETQLQARIEARKMLKDKILALKAKFGFGKEKHDQQIDMLSQRVDSLIEVVAKLAQQQATEKKAPAKIATKPAAKATATKAPAKAATKPAAKATATKVPAKTATKPAAKATATKAPAKTAAKPAAKATATKAPAKMATKPAVKASAAKEPAAKPAPKDTVTEAPAKTVTKPAAVSKD
tara:strand:- start:3126 stop:3818 length:693 start_codon:yes stop_codon:yes gene_type:complete